MDEHRNIFCYAAVQGTRGSPGVVTVNRILPLTIVYFTANKPYGELPDNAVQHYDSCAEKEWIPGWSRPQSGLQ